MLVLQTVWDPVMLAEHSHPFDTRIAFESRDQQWAPKLHYESRWSPSLLLTRYVLRISKPACLSDNPGAQSVHHARILDFWLLRVQWRLAAALQKAGLESYWDDEPDLHLSRFLIRIQGICHSSQFHVIFLSCQIRN